MLFNFIGLMAVATSCGVAIRWGGLDERLASLGFVLATLASQIWTKTNYAHTETIVLMIDAALLVGLVILALRSDRFWPMWAAAFQLVGTTVHFASMTETGDYAWAYAVGLIFWSYPVLVALGVGTWLEGRHRRSQALA
jgi:hypothetical protein